jgi:signal transduction histidine kinase
LITPLRVLLIEESEGDAQLLLGQLRQGGYDPIHERIETADELRSALHRGGWDVIIADYSMPRLSGLEALAITVQLAPEVPFLMVSGTVGEEVAVESINAGAADYLMKESLIRFVPAVTRAVRDAAERRAMKRTEEVLREQRSLLGMIYDNTSDALALFTWDAAAAAWGLSSINRATLDLARTLGVTTDEAGLVGRPVEAVIQTLGPADTGETDGIVQDFLLAAESGRTRTREARLASDRESRHVELTLIPFFGPDGRSRHVLVAVRDVTERKRGEEAQREFEARLAQARKMEALGQLAGGIAHDFNNILTGIMGFADVIRRTSSDPGAAAFGGEIVQAAARARDLVRQILMFSRRQPAERRPVRLADVVGEVLSLVRSSAPPSVRVTSAVPEDLPYILGDPTQLHQVAMNLCTNAVQAMGVAGGRLEVALAAVRVGPDVARRHPPLREGECVRLTVADTGPGMPAAALDHLFEPFFTTKPPGVGTGLGLSVVHGVVQAHEGAVVVHTQSGQGTTFEVYLPAVGAPARTGDLPVTDSPTATVGRRILFVDDESSITRLAQVMLKGLGHSSSVFGAAADALAALTADPGAFDLMITDLTMPGMSGVELARRAREIRPDLPIVLSSGYADEVPTETLRTLGITEVLPKPFQMQALGAAIGRANGS